MANVKLWVTDGKDYVYICELPVIRQPDRTHHVVLSGDGVAQLRASLEAFDTTEQMVYTKEEGERRVTIPSSKKE